jgi:hypothetical protein
MVVAGLIVDLIFKSVGLVRMARDAKVVQAGVHGNCTTVLNIIFPSRAAGSCTASSPPAGSQCCG